MKTLILGASTNPERYAYLATEKLLKFKHEIVLFGIKEGKVFGHKIQTNIDLIPSGIHTVTMYVGPKNQRMYQEFLLNLKPKRVIFNPGAENEEMSKLLENKGIETLEACTLVMLGTGQY